MTVALLYSAHRADEMNAVVRVVVGTYGQWELVAFLVCIVLSVSDARTGDEVLFYLPPTALAVVGAFTTAYDIRLFVE